MDTLFSYVAEQYRLVQESRSILFDYCGTIAPDDFVKGNTSFGRGGSIRNLLVHIANVYEYWIGQQALHEALAITNYASNTTIADVIELFKQVDTRMQKFMQCFNTLDTKNIQYELNGVKTSTSPLKLFTHVITHEFHHKGQILSISRHIGYTPIDTDIIR